MIIIMINQVNNWAIWSYLQFSSIWYASLNFWIKNYLDYIFNLPGLWGLSKGSFIVIAHYLSIGLYVLWSTVIILLA